MDLGQLWKLTNSNNIPHTIPQSGDIINFRYVGQRPGKPISDPTPLVLLSDVYTDAIRGVNLNALTFPYVRSMIFEHLGKPFSYSMIKSDLYITKYVHAFRTYKRTGISNLRILDTNFLIGLASVARSMDKFEVEQMKAQIEALIRQANVQPVAGPGTVDYGIR